MAADNFLFVTIILQDVLKLSNLSWKLCIAVVCVVGCLLFTGLSFDATMAF